MFDALFQNHWLVGGRLKVGHAITSTPRDLEAPSGDTDDGCWSLPSKCGRCGDITEKYSSG